MRDAPPSSRRDHERVHALPRYRKEPARVLSLARNPGNRGELLLRRAPVLLRLQWNRQGLGSEASRRRAITMQGTTRLTSRDVALLVLAQVYRGLSPKEAAWLCTCAEKRIRRRLLRLFRAGYLSRMQTPLLTGIGRAPFRYLPSNPGRRVIAERRSCPIADVRPITDVILAPHAHEVRDVQILLHGSAVKSKFHFNTVAEWKPFADTPDLDEQLTTACVRPDAALCMATSKSAVLFFLEVDRGHQTLRVSSATQRSVRDKLQLYCALYDSNRWKRWEEWFGRTFTGFRVLYVTGSVKRAEEVVAVAREIPDCCSVWAAARTELQASPMGSVWLANDRQGRVPLVEKVVRATVA